MSCSAPLGPVICTWQSEDLSAVFTASYLSSPGVYCPNWLGREPLIPRSEGLEAGPAFMRGGEGGEGPSRGWGCTQQRPQKVGD